MKVKEFMTTNIESIDHKRSVYYGIERMVNRRIRSLLIRFPGKEIEYGVITARDVVFKVLAKGLDPKNIIVEKIASKPIVAVDQNTDFKEVAKIMEESDIARAFVCDQDRVVGLVALMDVMSATIIERARGEYVS
jgi:predicted transcriptional regulator